jgi:hypothetical protein
MTLSGIETHPSSQTLLSSTQDRHHVTASRASHDAPDRAKEQSPSRGSSLIQDQVTLSKEAQALSASDPQALKNNTFQESPFDR